MCVCTRVCACVCTVPLCPEVSFRPPQTRSSRTLLPLDHRCTGPCCCGALTRHGCPSRALLVASPLSSWEQMWASGSENLTTVLSFSVRCEQHDSRREDLPCTRILEKICHILQLHDWNTSRYCNLCDNLPLLGVPSLSTSQSNVVIYRVHCIREHVRVELQRIIS